MERDDICQWCGWFPSGGSRRWNDKLECKNTQRCEARVAKQSKLSTRRVPIKLPSTPCEGPRTRPDGSEVWVKTIWSIGA